jgi:hypothetical protein
MEFLKEALKVLSSTQWNQEAVLIIEKRKDRKLSENIKNDEHALRLILFCSKSAEIITKSQNNLELAQELYEHAWKIYEGRRTTNFSHPFVALRIAKELVAIYEKNPTTLRNAINMQENVCKITEEIYRLGTHPNMIQEQEKLNEFLSQINN